MFFKAAIAIAVSIGSLSAASARDFTVGEIAIEHPWSRPTPPNAQVAGGFVTLVNNGSTADTLVAIESPLADVAEIHRSIIEDGVASMRKIDGIPLAPGETVDLESERIHFMFVKPRQRLTDGDSFAATLVFEKAGRVDVEFAVQRQSGPQDSSEHSGHGG